MRAQFLIVFLNPSIYVVPITIYILVTLNQFTIKNTALKHILYVENINWFAFTMQTARSYTHYTPLLRLYDLTKYIRYAQSAPTFMPHGDRIKSLLYTTMRLSHKPSVAMRSKYTREGMKGDGHTATNWPISSGKLSAVELGYMKVLGQKERRQIYVHLYSSSSGQRDAVWVRMVYGVKRRLALVSSVGGGAQNCNWDNLLPAWIYTLTQSKPGPKTCSPDNYYGYLRWMLWPTRCGRRCWWRRQVLLPWAHLP